MGRTQGIYWCPYFFAIWFLLLELRGTFQQVEIAAQGAHERFRRAPRRKNRPFPVLQAARKPRNS